MNATVKQWANELASVSNRILTGSAGLEDANTCMRIADALGVPAPAFDVWLRHSQIPGGAVAYGHLRTAFEAGAAHGVACVPAAPDGRRERMAFYEAAMKDEKNHAALAFEMAYLRSVVDGFGSAEPGTKE
jgi:hypothetical protein